MISKLEKQKEKRGTRRNATADVSLQGLGVGGGLQSGEGWCWVPEDASLSSSAGGVERLMLFTQSLRIATRVLSVWQSVEVQTQMQIGCFALNIMRGIERHM